MNDLEWIVKMRRESACVEGLAIGVVDRFGCSSLVEFPLALLSFPRGEFTCVRRDSPQPLRRLTVEGTEEVRREIWGCWLL
jgi:hypothetical protein